MKKLWKGNNALAEGAIAGGLDAYFGYPITPQNEIPEYMSKRMRELDRVFLQSESEPAAINMVLGTALTGKNTMTTSSSPGISLMTEGISYLVGCELPVVIANVQRGGPGLGNISGSQGDYFQAVKGGGHGDYRMIVLTPATVQEMFDMARDSFRIAHKYRNPVMILTDGVIGQLLEPIEMEMAKQKTKTEPEDLGWNLIGAKDRDSRMIKSLFMAEGALEEHNYKLAKKYEQMKEELSWKERDTEDADIILVGYGTTARILMDTYLEARQEGLKVGYFRLKTVYPFPSERLNELASKSKFLAVEMSMGQMVEDVRLAVNGKNEVGFYGRPGGGLPEAQVILDKIRSML